MDRTWFEMRSIRRRLLDNSVWIPLRQSESNKEGELGAEGFSEEYLGCGSLLIPLSWREAAEDLDWTQVGPSREHGPIIEGEHYVRTGDYPFGASAARGEEPVLEQIFSDGSAAVWHLNPDIAFALGLLREQDAWVRPDERYTVVARLSRDESGKPNLLEIRSEFLKDYLCARNMALRVSRYISRSAILEDISQLEWSEGTQSENTGNQIFQRSAILIHEGGHIFGAETAVIHLARNDVDPDDDVPVMGQVNNDNVDSSSWTTRSEGRPLYRVAGEFWSNDWIQPAEHSPRVRWDHVPSSCQFIVGAAGERQNADDLNNETGARWLWFRSELVEAALECRGSRLEWYTRDTGGIRAGPGPLVHFGLNDLQLINVLAADIASLPEWQKRLWVAYNISPEGKVSRELLASQVRAHPAETRAPERYFKIAMDCLDAASVERWGQPLFREHRDVNNLVASIHRFRAKDLSGLLTLAKDVNRLVSDRINVSLLNQVAPPGEKEGRRSLKSLEAALATIITPDEARSTIAPLVGVYDLRLGDAHLSSSTIQDALI